ncbi:MAG: VOC family protein [Bryobacteraceae bacterium]|nr:VOC family protein [Bryobacteraceae bacterium]
MLGNSDLVAFVLTADAARAKAFYGETLGLRFVSQDDFAVVFDANGVTVRVTPMPGHKGTEHTVLGWDVADIAATVAGLAAKGVKFEKYGFLEQDDTGVWTAPGGVCKVAWFKDPDGNTLSLTQY